jgi:hypothetical protein
MSIHSLKIATETPMGGKFMHSRIRLITCQLVVDALQKETLRFEELEKVLDNDENVKSVLWQRHSQVGDAMGGEARVQSELGVRLVSCELRCELLEHTCALVMGMQNLLGWRRETSRVLRQITLDGKAAQKCWSVWEEEYWEYVSVLVINLEMLNRCLTHRSTERLVQVVRGRSLFLLN